jgi:hypothetical protein
MKVSALMSLVAAARFCFLLSQLNMTTMKKNKKIREPFEPGDTPKPPQIIEPNAERQRENPVGEESRATKTPDNNSAKKNKMMGDEAEIDDETTI